MIQVSGQTFTYGPQGRVGGRVRSASVNGRPLDARARYHVATNSLLDEGGHNYQTFRAIASRTDPGGQFEIIKKWLHSHPGIATPPPGCIKHTSH